MAERTGDEEPVSVSEPPLDEDPGIELDPIVHARLASDLFTFQGGCLSAAALRECAHRVVRRGLGLLPFADWTQAYGTEGASATTENHAKVRSASVGTWWHRRMERLARGAQ